MKKHLSKIIIIVLSLLLVVVSTLFVVTLVKLRKANDNTSTSPNNTIKGSGSGELQNITLLSEGSPVTSSFSILDMYPGDSYSNTYNIEIQEVANVIYFSLIFSDNTQNPTTEQINRDRSLMTIVVTANGDEIYNGELKDLQNIDYDINGSSEIEYEITIALDTSAGNEYSNLDIGLSLQWYYEYDKYFTIKYYDGLGGEIFAEQSYDVIEGGNTPSFNGTPAREGYKFAGWNPELSQTVTEDITYTAQWEELYFVKYTDGSGEGLYFEDQLFEGLELNSNTPSFNGTPTREDYVFKNWNPTYSTKVTGNVVYTAVWEERIYKVIYTDGKGGYAFSDREFQVYKKGNDTPVFEGTPTYPKHKFIGWYPEVSEKVTEDVTYTALWELLICVTYTDGSGKELYFEDEEFYVDKGTTPPYFSPPTREAYHFTGWSPEVSAKVTENVTYTASWEINHYTVTYTDGIGGTAFTNQVYSTGLFHGANTPSFVGTPTRSGYKFSGWTPLVESTVTKDVTYTAIWEYLYTVRYTDGSGSESYFEDKVFTNLEKSSNTPLFGDNPTREGYEFTGWSPEINSKVENDITYTAQWTDSKFAVTYVDGVDGSVFTTQEYTNLVYNSDTPLYNGTPSRSGYKFTGWNPTVASKVKGNITYTAVWMELYTITYTDGSGSESYFKDQVFVDKSEGDVTPPCTRNTTRENYTFIGWSPEKSLVVSASVTYVAQWKENKYTVAYVDGVDGIAFTKQLTEDLSYGSDTPSFNGTPTRSGYKFIGWNPSIVEKVTENTTYTAIWEELYTVTYTDGSGEGKYFEDKVFENLEKNSQTPVYSGTPTRSGYKFIGWNPSVVTNVLSNVTYTAVWEELFTVKYIDGVNGQVFVDQVFTNIDRGSATPAFAGTPFREGYEFVGWYPEVYEMVNESVTYVAKWKTNSIEQLEITDTEQKVTSEIKLESLDYTKEESRRYKVVVNQEGNNVLYFNYNITSDKNSLRNAVIAKVVSDEDGKVIYEGLLKDMPKLISINLSGKQGEEKYYTVTLTLDQNAGGDYSQSTLDLVLSWWIDPEECICQFCLICYLANKWFGHCCLFPFCYVSYALLLGGGIFTVVMIAKAKKKKKKELEEAKKAQEYYQNIEQIVNDYMNNKEYNQMIEQIINDYMNNNNKKD